LIDLHCHILPALDDGPPDLEGSLELARAAAAAGTRTVVATPHIREDHPFDIARLPERVESLNAKLNADAIELRVMPGGEVALSKLPELDDAALEGLCLGSGRCLLVESPYTDATDMLEGDLFNLQVRGFRPLLAHPERSPSFQSDIDRLARLVDRGVLCSVTAASMSGRFGRTVRRFTIELFRARLVHDVASDAHDAVTRSPDLGRGFTSLEHDLPGAPGAASWFTAEAPAAILAGDDLPPGPGWPRQDGGVRRLFRRRRSRPGSSGA
jgi:protein-tyrosine phosphatase